MKKEAWAIETSKNSGNFIGYLWFSHRMLTNNPPWRSGLGVALFSTREQAREHNKQVRGPATLGRYSCSRVTKVSIEIN